jgi:hypothetical protein
MPELHEQITQAIEAMNRSPHVVSTPDNIQQPMLSLCKTIVSFL